MISWFHFLFLRASWYLWCKIILSTSHFSNRKIYFKPSAKRATLAERKGATLCQNSIGQMLYSPHMMKISVVQSIRTNNVTVYWHLAFDQMTFCQGIWPNDFLPRHLPNDSHPRHLIKWLSAKAFNHMTFCQGIWPNDFQPRHLTNWLSVEAFDQMTLSQGIWQTNF